MRSKDLIDEIDFEVTSTGKLLERVPADRLTWKPHEKAMTLGELAYHVANIPGNYASFAAEGTTDVRVLTDHYIPASKTEIMESFPMSIKTAKHILEQATEEWYATNWELIKDGKSVLVIPRSLMCRLLILNHWIHHRGELVTYLRTLHKLIPSVYGPSADEDPFA